MNMIVTTTVSAQVSTDRSELKMTPRKAANTAGCTSMASTMITPPSPASRNGADDWRARRRENGPRRGGDDEGECGRGHDRQPVDRPPGRESGGMTDCRYTRANAMMSRVSRVCTASSPVITRCSGMNSEAAQQRVSPAARVVAERRVLASWVRPDRGGIPGVFGPDPEQPRSAPAAETRALPVAGFRDAQAATPASCVICRC